MTTIKIGIGIGIITFGMSIASTAVAGSCTGTYCSVSYGGLNDGLCNADCNTFTETVVTSPITGSSVEHLELIMTNRGVNCDSVSRVVDMSYDFTNSESISHSGTGLLKSEVIGKVGQKDVFEVGLSHATEDSTTKIWTTTFSENVHITWKPSVPACTAMKLKIFGLFKTGSFSGTGHVTWSVSGRWCFQIPWTTITGTCASTSSSVSSSHRRYFHISPVNSTEPATPQECQQGCTPRPEETNPVGGE